MFIRETAAKILITAKDEASGVFAGLQRNAGKIAAAIAGYFGVKLFGDSVRAAEDLDQQMRKLDATIASTGGAAGLTAQEIDAMARRLDEATLGSAAGFRDAAAQLLTFKSVGRDAFETTLKLAQDLAANGFGTLESNAVQLGRALEDPVRGLTALRRTGVTFSESQEAVIKRLVETGRQAEAQAIILEAVSAKVGGVASAMGGGLSGALDLVNKRFTDLKEQLGAAVLPVFQRFQERLADLYKRLADSGVVKRFGEIAAAALSAASDAFFKFADSFDLDAIIAKLRDWATATRDTVEQWGQYLSTAGTVTAGAVHSITTGINVIRSAFFGVAGAVAVFVQAVLDGVARINEGMASLTFGDLSRAYEQVAATLRNVAESVGASADENFRKAQAALDDTAASAARLRDSAAELFGFTEQATAGVDTLAGAAKSAGEQATLTAEQVAALGEGMEFVDGQSRAAAAGLGEAGKAASAAASDLEKSVAQTIALENAYKTLGVTSQAELREVAEAARLAYQTIRDSGTAAPADIAAAFEAYATRAVAATGGVVEATLQAEAATLGLSVQADETGRVIVSSMQAAYEALQQLSDGADEASDRIAMIGSAADEAAAAVQGLTAAQEGADAGGRRGGGRGGQWSSPFQNLYARAEQIGGLTLRREMEQFYQEWARMQPKVGTVTSGITSLYQILGRMTAMLDERQMQKEAGGAVYGPPPQRAAAVPASGAYTVNVNVGGQSRSVSTSSEADARALIDILQEMERRSMPA